MGMNSESLTVWLRHWNLVADPFPSSGGRYVATPPHDEAVARLVDAIRSRERWAVVRGEAGIGKSVALARALKESKTPGLRMARVEAPSNGHALYEGLARSLRLRLGPDSSRSQTWRTLSDAARLIAAQRGSLVLAVDDAHHLTSADDRLDLERLLHLVPVSTVTLIVLERPDDTTDGPIDAFPIRLDRLTRTESTHYLSTKLQRVGRDAPTFAPTALTRLHAMSAGIPRIIDRLAGFALRAGAIQGLKLIPDDLVEAVSQEMRSDRLGPMFHGGLNRVG